MVAKSRKRTVILLLCLFAEATVLGGVLGWRGGSHLPKALPKPRAFDFEVAYTASGFAPPVLRVPLGSRVAFKNLTRSPLWLGADPFLTHSDYPDLDARRNYGQGEVFVFRFDRSGTFGYNNDRKAGVHGTIQVADPDSLDSELDKTPDEQLDIRDGLFALMDPSRPLSLYRVIDAIGAQPDLALSCHGLAHDLGHHAYELWGFSASINLSDPDRKDGSVQEFCAGGYVHGVLEETSLHMPDFLAHPETLCADGPNRSSCLHGLGHAFMYDNGRNVERSLEACRNLPGRGNSYPCFEGVWMEFFLSPPRGSTPDSQGWDPEHPLEPCRPVADDAKAACYLYSSFGYLHAHYLDYSGAVSLCTSGLGKIDEQFCLKGIGITMTGHFKAQQLERTEPFVAHLTRWEKAAFYQGVFGYARFSGVPDDDLAATARRMTSDGDLVIAALAADPR